MPAECEEILPGSDFDDDLVVDLRNVQIPVCALDVDLAVCPDPVVFSALDQVRDLLLEAPVVKVVVELRGKEEGSRQLLKLLGVDSFRYHLFSAVCRRSLHGNSQHNSLAVSLRVEKATAIFVLHEYIYE